MMKRNAILVILVLIPFFVKAQSIDWESYTWDTYHTSFDVPSDFVVSESSGTVWKGGNGNINLSIYPRQDEYLSYEDMESNLRTWAQENGVGDLSDLIDLDEEKMNGYWGVLIEGSKSGWPVGLMLIVDPEYPEISLYIWVSYAEEYMDQVLEMLMSFTPI